MSTTVPVAVVGAGPYGLSVAAHLASANVETRVFGEPMGAWRDNMPRGMLLKSTPRASSISGPEPGSTFADHAEDSSKQRDDYAIPLAEFVAYGARFQERYVPHVQRERVKKISRASRGFHLTLGSGEELDAARVVIGTGHVSFAHVPQQLDELAGGRPGAGGPVSHASQHVDLSRFMGRDVAVVGGGQSALETAALLAEAGAEAHVLVRAPRVLWGQPPDASADGLLKRMAKPPSSLGPGWSLYAMANNAGLVHRLPARARLHLVKTVLGPSGAWWLHDRVVGSVDVRTGCGVEKGAVSGERVTLKLTGGDQMEVDHVIAATGYRIDVDRFGFLADDVRDGLARVARAPRLDAGFESSVPGLFFTGLAAAPSFGPVLRFVCGTGIASRRITRRIASQPGFTAR